MTDTSKVAGERNNYFRKFVPILIFATASGGSLEGQNENFEYPKAIPFIISSEFCERFSFYGLRAFLVLYLTRKLMFEEDFATVIYHVFTALVYFFCLTGAIIADSFLGRFLTVLLMSIVYAVGSCLVTVGSVEVWNLPAVVFTSVGLFLVAVGSGGIKPCVAVFGANQFKLPEQAPSLTRYFSVFYFAINLGSFLSFLVTPFLRDDVQCFGKDDCFPAAFGLPALLMIISIFVFMIGKIWYKMMPVKGNMFVKICGCIWVRIYIVSSACHHFQWSNNSLQSFVFFPERHQHQKT